MRQFQDVNGGVLSSAREYDIAANTDVTAGMVVKIVDGLVVAVSVAETGAILGYAAENHGGADDALNQRANGTRILVQDSPAAVAESHAPTLTASGGTTTTVTVDAMAAFAANAFKGGYLKGPDGGVRLISASAVASGVLTLTVAAGAAPVSGDKHVLFPPFGFNGGNLDAGKTKLVLTATAALPVQVIGRDEGRNMIWTAATKHQLAAVR